MNYGEAASAVRIAADHLFKKFFRGFDANILTWLPYDEVEDNELVLPVKFWFESGCSDETNAAIFSYYQTLCTASQIFPWPWQNGSWFFSLR